MSDPMSEWVDKLVVVYGAGPNGASLFAVLAGFNDTEEWYADQDSGETIARFPRGKYDVRLYKARNGEQ